MKVFELIAISLGLSLDAFAVAIASGCAVRRTLRIGYALRIAACFGLAQMLMPILGWLGGRGVRDAVAAVDHWIAFGLLTFIGGKMIYEAFALEKAEHRNRPMGMQMLLTLAVATSIDALAVGFSLSMLRVAIIAPALVIGAITFAMSLAGVFIGERFGHCFENKIEIAGGLVLIGIGARILWQHLA